MNKLGLKYFGVGILLQLLLLMSDKHFIQGNADMLDWAWNFAALAILLWGIILQFMKTEKGGSLFLALFVIAGFASLIFFFGNKKDKDSTRTGNEKTEDSLEKNVGKPREIVSGKSLLKNSDFSQGLKGWGKNISNKGKQIVKVIKTKSDKILLIKRTESHCSGTYCGIIQKLNLPLNKVKKLILRAELRADYQSLTYRGGNAVEYPIGIRLRIEDSSFKPKGYRIWQCGLIIKGKSCGLVKLVKPGRWVKVRKNLKKMFPRTAKLCYLQVVGGGWDYTGKARNISLQVK